MKVLILSASESIHTKRWCEALIKSGVQVVLFSLSSSISYFYQNAGIKVYSPNINSLRWYSKIRYLSSLKLLRNIISIEKPDIVHAHYCSSYGLLGALSRFHPLIVSVWGSDVYDFPKQSCFFEKIIRYVLSKADKILSTSHIMAKETSKYTNKPINITPFGVNIDLFRKIDILLPDKNTFVVGNVKTLAPKYGIDILIKAFKVVLLKNPDKDMVLKIVGDGPCRKEYEQLAADLGINDKVYFIGKVSNEKLPEYYNSFSVSVSVSVSNSESFGVVAVEAMACECPVITSDADGFTEVVEDRVTGIIVPKQDVDATASAIQEFINNPDLREKMGKAGRERVKRLYDWNDNVMTMVNIYNNTEKNDDKKNDIPHADEN